MAAITVTQFRCALYARVSARDKDQEVENQLRRLREFAAQNGWLINAEYIDHESSKISDREQFQAMFDAASKLQFDVLLFWNVDRLNREGDLPTLQHLQKVNQLWRELPLLHRVVFRLLYLPRRRDPCDSRQAKANQDQ